MKQVDRAILLLLAAIFVFSSVDKFLHYENFVNALRNYVLVPRGTAPFLATPVIVLELMIGLGLIIHPWRRAAALTAAITLACFTAAVALNHFYGERGICGCWFTITLAKGTTMHLVQNFLFLGMASSLWLSERGRSNSESALSANPAGSHPEPVRPGEGPFPTNPQRQEGLP